MIDDGVNELIGNNPNEFDQLRLGLKFSRVDLHFCANLSVLFSDRIDIIPGS